MMQNSTKIGDLVWAKMRNYHPWPGKVVPPRPNMKKPSKKMEYHCIYFFGSHNYAYIDEDNIKQYEKYKTIFAKVSKLASFKKAVNEIEEFIKKKEEDPNYDLDLDPIESSDFDKIKEEKEETPTKKRKLSVKKRPSSGAKSTTPSTKKWLMSNENGSGSSPSGSSHPVRYYDELLNKPTVLDVPDTPMVDFSTISDEMRTRTITASTAAFGFLGLGIMGSGIVKNLIASGHSVNIWCRNSKKMNEFKGHADESFPGQVQTCLTPSDVVQNSDIIFCCVSDPAAVKEIIYGNCGVMSSGDSLVGKGYVEMTNIDSDSSIDISNAIAQKGGRYLEAQLQGSKQEADEGSLIVLGAGDKSLFDDCHSCFKAIGKTIFYLGEVGFASKMNLVLQVMKGIALAGVAEGFALADRSGLSVKDVLEIFNLTTLASPFLQSKAEMIISMKFNNVEQPIQHMQKDMRLALQLGDAIKQPLLMTSTANELYKHSRRMGEDSRDAASVYKRTRY